MTVKEKIHYRSDTVQIWGGFIKPELHPFHLVDPSPYPASIACALFFITFSTVWLFHHSFIIAELILYIALGLFFYIFISWFHDIILESKYKHTIKVQKGLANGMQLFIASEIMFFFSFFWAFFYASVSPAIQIGCVWPPVGITPIFFASVPLLNTLLLLSSGVSVTWAHKAITNKNKFNVVLKALTLTIVFGIIFTALQALEYWEAPFSFSDGTYGSIFFLATGFHGAHVLIGTLFLLVCLFRQYYRHFTITHHFGLIAAIWYWHFVDVVWIFLYITIYWWGGY